MVALLLISQKQLGYSKSQLKQAMMKQFVIAICINPNTAGCYDATPISV